MKQQTAYSPIDSISKLDGGKSYLISGTRLTGNGNCSKRLSTISVLIKTKYAYAQVAEATLHT